MKSASDSATGAAGDNELEKIKVRIRKMLSRGLHAGTPEEEAASSMRLAEKLLAKHNLAQADVLQEDHVPEALRGGKTAVHLRSVKDQTPCQTKQWMHTLAHACTKNFECSYYFSSHPTRTVGRLHYPGVCDFTFYGIATNASLAAFAFAAAFNRIACLAALHVVPAQEYEVKRRRGEVVCSKGAYTTAARESYKDGLARGLYDSVREDKARKELEQQRRLELARSKASRGEAWQSSDDDDDDDDGGDDCIRDDGGGGAPAGGNHASSRGTKKRAKARPSTRKQLTSMRPSPSSSWGVTTPPVHRTALSSRSRNSRRARPTPSPSTRRRLRTSRRSLRTRKAWQQASSRKQA